MRIVGEVFDPGQDNGFSMFTDWSTPAGAEPRLTPQWYDVRLRAGTSPQAYANAVGTALGPEYPINVSGSDPFFATLIGLIGTLTLLLALVAGLGVLNTVVLHTRERAHDLGVFKAVGMTPRQTMVMVMCSVGGTGLLAGVVAVPAGVALHGYVLPIMGHAAGTGIPAGLPHVYRPTLLALSGLVIAVCGALLPAGWAAGARTAPALRAE